MSLSSSIYIALGLAMVFLVPWVNRIAYGSVGWFQIVASLAAGVSLFCAPGSLPALLLSGVWLLWAFTHFVLSLRQALLWGHDQVGRCFATIGNAFLIGGAVWAFAARSGEPFLNFAEPWKTLTAIHFHYSGFLLTTIFALHWECVRDRLSLAIAKFYSSSMVRYLIGFTLVAIGLNGVRIAEVVGIGLIFLSVVANSAILLWAHWERLAVQRRAGLVFLCAIGIASMSLALAYGFRFTLRLNLMDMIVAHGLLNAFLWIPGLIYFTHLTTTAFPRRDVPFSHLYSKGKIGPEFFSRLAKFGDTKKGLVDSFSEFERSDFFPESVDPEVQRFYENTNEYELSVTARPALFFRPIWLVLQPFFSAIQQLNLPDRSKTMHGSIVGLMPAVDGRKDPRGWMRVDAETGRTIYAAAYAIHRSGHFAYMNIAFPLPFCNMASILHVEHLDGEEHGIELTTLRSFNSRGDQGVYLVRGKCALRLPLDETIEVWSEKGKLFATHRMWLFGFRYLTLDYDLRRREAV